MNKAVEDLIRTEVFKKHKKVLKDTIEFGLSAENEQVFLGGYTIYEANVGFHRYNNYFRIFMIDKETIKTQGRCGIDIENEIFSISDKSLRISDYGTVDEIVDVIMDWIVSANKYMILGEQ